MNNNCIGGLFSNDGGNCCWIIIIALIVLSPVLLILIIVGAIAMKGNPFFTQLRPGKIDPKTGQ